jgi:FdhE protein
MSEGDGPKLGLMNIGDEAKPPFAVLPDATAVYASRAKRFRALALGHELGPYLNFLAKLSEAQQDVQADLPPLRLPSSNAFGQALEHGMPPIARVTFAPDDATNATLDRLWERLIGSDVPGQAADAISALRSAPANERRTHIQNALQNTQPNNIACRVLVMAGLQVHFVRLAAMLVADDLKPIADAACPVCGSPPMTSSVVGWPKAHNTRFCTCPLCATRWNVVRVKCVLCSATGGITYRSIQGKPDTVKAETCDTCRSYVKILYEVNDPMLEAAADDVASVGLDMLLAEEGWKRGAQNPFLLGY